MIRDLRHAVRLLVNHPGFSAVALITIALAIGANTAMFSLVNGLLLRPLPYPDPLRIVRVLERHPTGGVNSISTSNYLDWARQSKAFEYLAAETRWDPTLTGATGAVVLLGARVSANYFDIFGVQLSQGRTFRPGDDEVGSDRVVVISHRLWATRFGSSPDALGRSLRLDGEPHTVIGILPEGGPFDRAVAQIWKPLALSPGDTSRDFRWLGATAKLKPGVALDQARAEMDVIGERLARAYPASNAGWGIAVDRLQDVLVGPSLETAVTILFTATGLVLLIGCANLANLALARGISREGEMAVRAALGATRRELVRQVLIENVVLSVCGGVVGIAVGYALLAWFLWLIPPTALPPAVDVSVDASVLLFTTIMAIGTGLLFGVAPASQILDWKLSNTLREGGLGAGGVRRGRIRQGLVVAEVALAVTLLVASGLLMRSFFRLLDVDPGFTAAAVLTAGVPISQERHPNPDELRAYVGALRTAVERVPGVRETAVTSALPLRGWGYGVPYAIAGRPAPDRTERRPAFFKIVSPSYFSVLNIPLRAGRGLSVTDTVGAPPVTVINEALARREFPGEDPIGHRILVSRIVPGRTQVGDEVAWEIVGVIAQERVTGLDDSVSAGLYVSDQQNPTYSLSMLVRTSVPPQSLEQSVRSAVAAVNRDQALSDVQPMERIVQQSMFGTRTAGVVLAVFAGMALVLASLGIYGVMAYTALQRTQEMGIRAALGAGAGDLRRLIMTGGMRLTAIGLGLGVAGSLVAMRAMSSLLYGVRADDPLTIAIVVLVLMGVASMACGLAAWRMTTVDPMVALRRP